MHGFTQAIAGLGYWKNIFKMIKKNVTTVIDSEKCIGCGQCVLVCPSETLSLQNNKASVTGNRSMGCGHCEAVCPVGAIHVNDLNLNSPVFHSFEVSNQWVPFGHFNISQLVGLIKSRRSCRNYTQQHVERELLEDLVNIGIYAPSGTNSQKWTFTILPDRESVMVAANRILYFFRNLNRKAENTFLRKAMKLAGKPALDQYYHSYYKSVKKGIEDYHKYGRDLLFHGATAAILVGSRPGGSCPSEDALLATQNILLAAHALGLGSCLIGFAVEAVRHDPSIKQVLAIPNDERIHSVIALGYPDEKYQTTCKRKKPVIRYLKTTKRST
jgi:nitroreductase/NAD-dependent dihydropyrimidine dehydrogenase PreA subunit